MNGKHALILGAGETGLSMARWLARAGANVRVADTRAAPPGAARLHADVPNATLVTGPFTAATFAGVDLIAASPGVPLAEPEVQRAIARGVEVVGDIELFARALPRVGRPRILAVTGTNGKSTVTALAGALVRAAGVDVEVAGNIGPAVLDALMRRDRAGTHPAVWVLELSSYQLETTASLDADAAVMLNLTEDHLDRYASLAEYGRAKARIFDGRGLQIVNRDDAASLAMRRAGREWVSFGLGTPPRPEDYGLLESASGAVLARGSEPILDCARLPLAGMHNCANALAALALAGVLDLPLEALARGLTGFRGLPHRVERVAEVDDVVFYDDSKGTNVGATVAALDGFARSLAVRGAKVVLIAGGDGKGQDFAPLATPLARAARALVTIGRDGPLIEAAARGSGVPIAHAASMDDAVKRAHELARRGDVVLLSPACASFDMFDNYSHRGEVFAAVVKGLMHARHA